MPSKYYNRNFRPQYFYHIFNRGAYKNKVFLDKPDYEAFVAILSFYLIYPKAKNFAYQKKVNEFQVPNLEKVQAVHLVAYCLMPNHFHLLLKQLPNATLRTNISNLMRRTSIAYAMYFQNKHKHTGALFQGKFKNTTISSNDELVLLSKYIHLNPKELTGKFESFSYSSYPAYINRIKPPEWLHPEYVLRQKRNYKKFVASPEEEEKNNMIEKIILE